MKCSGEIQGKALWKILSVVVIAIVVVAVVAVAIIIAPPIAPPKATVVSVSGRATFDNGEAMKGAQVLGRIGYDTSTAVTTVTDSSGNFTMELVPGALPARVLVEVSFESAPLPTMQATRWGNAESNVLDVGTIVIPSPEGAELTLANGAGQSADNSIRVEGLTAEVDRLFARSYDPDNTPDAFPGEFAENGTIPLDSSVFLWMVGLDANGDLVDDLSQAATIRSLVPRSQWSDLVDINSGTDRIEVPIYTYNENTDVWEQENELGWLEDNQSTILPEDAQSVILDGTFSGEIYATFATNHLSWMNVDYPYIGPWTLSRVSRDKRNVDCLYNALKLAQKIANSENGRNAYAKVNKAGADLSIELADGKGPELKDNNLDGAYGEYHGDSGGAEDQFYMASSLWNGCAEGATEDQKKNTTLLMAVTILHESAHWKDDVKKFSDNDEDTHGEEGNQLEIDLFGGIITEDGGTIYRDGVAVDAATRDEWLNHDSWPSPAGAARAFSLSQELPPVQAQAGSDLEVTISLPKTTFELGEEIPVEVVYKNVGTAPIQVMNRVVLEGWPLYFNIINQQTGARVRFLGPELKLRIVDTDFTTLQPSGTLTQTVNLVRDPTTSARRYQLLSSGTYNITAVYETFRGVKESTSNTLTVTIGTGGSISGTVTNAGNGQPISGATVKVMEDNSVLTTATTGTNGAYSFPELPPGTYTLEARASGFLRSTWENIQVIAGQNTAVNFSLSPLLTAGETRLVLTWGENPYDLDSHLWLPEDNQYHIYYSAKGDNDAHPFAFLDVDDTSSYGPETITIKQRYSTGTYVYAIYHFAGSGDLTTSQAQVQVFDSTGLIATFNVPSVGTGRWWNVLTIDGATGGITENNQISDTSPAPY